MSFKLSLEGVEPWKAGGVILRTGAHPIRVVDEEITTSGEGDKKHHLVIVSLEAIGGEERGGEIRDWIHVTQASLGRVAQVYEAFKMTIPPGEFEWIPLKGKQAKIIVREKPGRNDPAKMFSEVASYAMLGKGDGDVASVERAFDGTEVADDEKDIPF